MKKRLFNLAGFLLISGSYFAQGLPVSQTPSNKIAVLEELTGIKCQYCPDGHRLANQIADANPGKVILVNVHAGGYANASPDYRTTEGNALDVFFNADGYPAGAVQRTPYGSETTIATGRENWEEQITTTLSQASPANVGMSAEIDYNTRVLKVKVEVFYTTPAAAGTNHYLNVGILQDGLTSTQTGANFNPTAILPDGSYEHKHMFRGYVNTGGTWGDVIDASQSGVITKEYEFTLPATVKTSDLRLGKLSFFAVLHEGHKTYSNSPIITGAQVKPTYINVAPGKIDLISVVGDYNTGCNSWGSFQPKISISNSGSTVNSMQFAYELNGQAYGQFEIAEPVAALESKIITLPTLAYATAPNSVFKVKLLSVNNATTGLGTTTEVSKSVKSAVALSSPDIVLEILTDNYPAETSGTFYKDIVSNTVATFGPFVGNGQNSGGADALKAMATNITLTGTGCYSLRLKDSYGDGMQYGSNPNGGFGFRIKQNGNVIVEDVRSSFDFGSSIDITGVVSMSVLGTNDLENQLGLSIFPNPVKDVATIQLNVATESTIHIEIVNTLGQVVSLTTRENAVGPIEQTINTASLSAGQYVVNVLVDDVKVQKKLTVVK